jgi:Uma2 family endonuclease
MAAHPTIGVSVKEYISRFIDQAEKPACEYVDGELIPKPMAGDDHSAVQSNLVFYLRSRYNNTLKIRPELHAKLKQTRFRIPDVVAVDRQRPFEGGYPGPENPAVLCIEIKSPDDSLACLWDKCREYHSWGVPYCWVIDPLSRKLWEYFADDAQPRPCLERISAGAVEIRADEVFEDL